MATLTDWTVGIKADFTDRGATAKVELRICSEENTKGIRYWFTRDSALEVAARLIAMATMLEPIDLTELLDRAEGGTP